MSWNEDRGLVVPDDRGPRRHIGVVLAAGGSIRLGEPKQLLRIGGRSLLAHSVELVRQTLPQRVLVVLGADSERMHSELDSRGITVVINDRWRTGIASSLQLVVAESESSPEAALLMIGVDQPRLTLRHLGGMLLESEKFPGVDVLSGYGGIAGIPALLQHQTLMMARSLRGDRGLQAILRDREKRILESPELIYDVDTPADLVKARRWRWID